MTKRGSLDLKAMSRLDRWKKSEFIDIPLTSMGNEFSKADNAVTDYINQIQKRFYSKSKEKQQPWLTQSGILRASKELIYDVQAGEPIFHVIGYSFNIRRGELQVGHGMDILIEGDSPEEIKDSITSTLAVAFIYEIPVYPNTDKLAEQLAGHYRDLMVQGFTAPDGKGGRTRLQLTKSPGSKIESIDFLHDLNISEPRHPAELALIRAAVKRELGMLSEAKRLVGSLELAIGEFAAWLDEKNRNEAKLQQCLTENPVLLGWEYRKVLPKYKLGAEYEMDYALQRYSGLVDLMELEASNIPVFNKKGDPSHYLIHAEQQVLNWLAWVERNHPYAREGLPGLMRPLGFVVIGRSRELHESQRLKLLQRNTLLRGSVQILTYDDVLERARTMHSVLTGKSGASADSA